MNPIELGAHCKLCPLYPTATSEGIHVLPKPAQSRVRLVIVTEPVTRAEENGRSPMSGLSGGILTTTLSKHGVSAGECYVTPATLCRPETDKDADVASLCCAPRVLRELKQIPKDVPVLVMGKHAMLTVLGVKNILVARGFIWRVKGVLEKIIKSLERQVDKKEGDARMKLGLRYETLLWRRAIRGRKVIPTLTMSFIVRADTFKPLLDIDVRRVCKLATGKMGALDDTTTYTTTGRL